jgi:bifunctional non-homologous end joining protein LigD
MSKNVRRVSIRDKTKSEDYLTIDGLDGLIELVQFGSLEIHPWGARIDDIEKPDRIIFDLDPDPSVPWKDVIAAAREIRTDLESVGLESFAKTTGGKGLHVVIPIVPKHTWTTVKGFARTFAEFLVERSPKTYTATPVKRARRGKIFIDYLRNERGATAIAPYSPRARAGAPVSVPLAWREVAPKLDPRSFTVDAVRKRLASAKADPWEHFFDIRQDIAKLSIAKMGGKRRSPKHA